jgi:DNA-binding response OmpR family regulator
MRLLVAEDHPTLAQSIVSGLEEEGYAVDLAQSGDDALHNAMHVSYDCIVLDLMLPGTDGWTILQTLRKNHKSSPVICLTARDALDDRVRGLKLGADDYLVKPFAWPELLARIAAVMRRSHGHRSPVLTVGDLEIDTARKEVARAGQCIKLTAREYALLEYLAYRMDQVVTRQEIWDHLYDHNDENTSNVVDVYIGYLRNKIEKGSNQKLIHTRRGQGYILSSRTHAAPVPTATATASPAEA